jgi:hypothetical protein
MPKRIATIATASAILVVAVVVTPRLLAFPYKAKVGIYDVYSEVPLRPQIGQVIERADLRLKTSPLYSAERGASIYLTSGGWRWRIASIGTGDAFAFTRPLADAVVINRSNVITNTVFNGQPIAGTRSLSGVIAHEITHTRLRAKYGLALPFFAPTWEIEGYCDYVAGESSLSDAQALRLISEGNTHPALPYWQGRRRVADILAKNGNALDRLFYRGK